MKNLFFTLVSVLLIAGCQDINIQKTCHLTGAVKGRYSKALILVKQTVNISNHDIEIPIDSTGHFYYDMKYNTLEAYELIFKEEYEKGIWKPILFFPDSDTIRFTLFPMDKADSNLIIGSELSLKEKEYQKALFDKYYDTYMYWFKKSDSLQTLGEINTEYASFISDKLKSIDDEIPFFELKYIKKEANIYGYSKLLSILESMKDSQKIPLDTLERYCRYYWGKFPNHPYTKISGYRLNGLKNIKAGGYYVNFTAPDSLGNDVELSDIIYKNRYTLLDLWSPWCSPCIRKSKKIKPLYDKYKNSGFEVVGVIGGVKSKRDYINAVRKYRYPWIELSEIKGKNNIWEKYNISNGAGQQFLIDNKGVIVAINPSYDELDQILREKHYFYIKGKIPDSQYISRVYLIRQQGDNVLCDSVELTNDRFDFSGFFYEPGLCALYTDKNIHNRKIFIIDEGVTEVTGNASDFKMSELSFENKKNNTLYLNFNNRFEEYESFVRHFTLKRNEAKENNEFDIVMLYDNKLDSLAQDQRKKIFDFVKNNSTYPGTAIAIYDILLPRVYLKPEEFKDVYNLYSENLKDSYYGKELKRAIDRMVHPPVEVGDEIIDFTMEDVAGRKVSVKEFRGKYVLIDFWASWCAPCRAEIPLLKEIYNKYKRKGFEIVGISIDTQKKRWKQALVKEKTGWINLIDVRGWESGLIKHYHIEGIPSNILLDKNGKIIAFNIHGKDLKNALGKLFVN